MADIQTVVRSVKEPLRAYNFLVELPSEFGNSDKLKYQVLSVSLPSFIGFDVEEMMYAPQFFVPFPVKFERGDELEISFWEDEELSVWKYFSNWRDKVVNMNEDDVYWMNYALRREYVRDVYIRILNVKGEAVRSVALIEAYPVKVSSFRFGYSENEVVSVDVSFVYKKIEIK